jgi:hypothetical protein
MSDDIISFKDLFNKLEKEDRSILEDVIKRLSRCQACNMIDKWMEKQSDTLVQKEIIKCAEMYNKLVEKVGYDCFIPLNNIEETEKNIRKLMFDFVKES